MDKDPICYKVNDKAEATKTELFYQSSFVTWNVTLESRKLKHDLAKLQHEAQYFQITCLQLSKTAKEAKGLTSNRNLL
jgi:hypothetical protein